MKLYILTLLLVLSSYKSTALQIDTTFLLKNESQSIFIDTSKKSRGYELLTRFKLDSNFFNKYSLSIKKNNGVNNQLKKISLDSSLPKRWVKIVLYKNKFYAYSPCDYLYDYRFTITDSCFVDYTDLLSPEQILNYGKINSSKYFFQITQIVGTKKVFFHIINKQKGIAIVEQIIKGKRSFCLIIDIEKIREIPIIVNHCIERADEYEFSEPDYKKLLKKVK